VIAEISAATLTSKPFLVLRPWKRNEKRVVSDWCWQEEPSRATREGRTVPTAVPPWARSESRGMTSSTREMALVSCWT
jgi:hypothetical protein